MSNLDPQKSNTLFLKTVLLCFVISFSLFTRLANADVTGSITDASGNAVICHYTGSGSVTIAVDPSAVDTHISHHGDYDGACAPTFMCTSDSYLFYSDADKIEPTYAMSVDLTDGTTKALNGGASFNATEINGIGYNLIDNFIWGYDRSTEEVVRVDGNYNVIHYDIAGLPKTAYHNGDVSPDGILFLAEKFIEPGKLYKVDVNPGSPNYLNYLGEIVLNPSIYSKFFDEKAVSDFAFHPKDRQLYTVGFDNRLYKINPDTGLVTDLGDIGITLSVNSNAVWFGDDGYLYFVGDNTTVFQIDIRDPANPIPTAINFSSLAFTSRGDAARCTIAPIKTPTIPQELSCSAGYKLETWPALSSGSSTFDSTNNLLRLTTTDTFTNITDPGTPGFKTSSLEGALVNKTLVLNYIDPKMEPPESFRILVYDVDSPSGTDQDFVYLTVGGVKIPAQTRGVNVEEDPLRDKVYRGIISSGDGTGAEDAYHTGFTINGIADGTNITLSSEFTGTGSESFVGFQACVKIPLPPPVVYSPQPCGFPGFLETFGSGAGRSPLPSSARTNYDYDEGAADTNNGAIVMDDQYTVLDKSTIASAGDWWIVDDDHTGDANGRMLLVNADYFPGEFYRQSITGLVVGKEYSFAAYIANAEGDTEVRIPVNVKFAIESGGAELAFVETGDILQDPGRDELAWAKYELKFTATRTDIDIVLHNNYGGGEGNDLVIDDISLSEVCAACSAFTGEVNEAAMPVSSQLKTSDKLFVPSKAISPIEGHLRAYAVDKDGQAIAMEDWDAANLMTTINRTSNLYSTDTSGDIILFNLLDDAAFGSSAIPVATIKEYTLDPSAAGGIYLAGRENGSFLGGISKGNSLALLTKQLDTSLYLNDTAYRDYYANTVSKRSERVLMTSDDGFLYAFDYASGNLIWAWMPRSLASQLSGYASFQSKHLMSGSLEVLDLDDGSGKYATYIIGSYKEGLGHYVLKLNADGSLGSVVWDDDQSSDFVHSPNNGEMEFFRDDAGKVYAAFALINSTLTSQLNIRSLTDSTVDKAMALTYQVTSTPFVMQDYGKSNAPAKKTIYLGTSTGAIHATEVLDSGGALLSVAGLEAGLGSSSVTDMDDSDTDAVLYINASVSAKDKRYYLSTQSATRITLHRYQPSSTNWQKAWTSYSSGAGSWDDAESYTADNSGVPTDKGGYAIIPPKGIQSLPVGAKITDKAVIVGDTVVLPLSVEDGGAGCYGKAYYYLYSLSDGTFPMQSFVTPDNTAMVTNIALGYGEAKRLSISDLLGSNKLLGYGIADKKTDLTSGIATSFVIKDPVSTGIRGWKELGR